MSDRGRYPDPLVLVLRDTANKGRDPHALDQTRRKLKALLKHLGREWHLRCLGFSIPATSPIMLTPGEGI